MLCGIGDLGERRQNASGSEAAESRRERDPAEAQHQQDQAQLGEDAVERAQRPGKLDRDPLAGERIGRELEALIPGRTRALR